MLLVLEMARQDVEGGSATQEGQGSGQADAVSHLRFTTTWAFEGAAAPCLRLRVRHTAVCRAPRAE